MKKILLLCLAALAVYGCTKDPWVFDDQTSVPGLDPSFAIPLVNTYLNLGDIEESLDDDGFIYSAENETFALIYRANVMEFTAAQMSGFGNEVMSASYTINAIDADQINAIPTGSSISLTHSTTYSIDAPNGEEIETITFAEDTLFVTFSTEAPYDQEITLTIPDLTLNGNSFSETIIAPYTGNSPFEVTAELLVTGYTLDLTQGQTTTNTFDIDIEMLFVKNANDVNAGSDLELEMQLDLSRFASVFGYFGQPSLDAAVGTHNVNLFEDIDGGIMHFVEPRLEFYFDNSTGITVDGTFTGIYAPENNVEQDLTGPDLSNLPQIARAVNPGEIATTTHTVTNDGVSPQLSTLLDEGPFTLLYSSEVSINPNGFDNNFLLDTSFVRCRSEIVLPFYGYADNFTQADTIDVDIAAELTASEGDVLTIEDIEQATIRLIADNGLPIEVGTQVYFVDSVYTLLDSLFAPGPYENILDPGFIDFSLPESHINHGRVLTSTRKITDITLTGEQLQFLADNHATKVIVRSFGHTNSADEEVVRFYPEYNIGMKISAKIDTDINLNE